MKEVLQKQEQERQRPQAEGRLSFRFAFHLVPCLKDSGAQCDVSGTKTSFRKSQVAAKDLVKLATRLTCVRQSKATSSFPWRNGPLPPIVLSIHCNLWHTFGFRALHVML